MIDVHGQQPSLPELLHPGSRALFRYWERIRGERSAPGRADMDLRAIGSLLPHVGVLERRRRPTVFAWRVAGSGIGEIWGREVTGQDLLASWKGMERHSLVSCLDAVVDSHQPFVARFSALPEMGEPVGVELIALPVRSNDGQATQVLCAVLPFRNAGWLSTRMLRRFVLASIRIIWTEPLPGDPLGAQRPEGGGRTAAAPLRVIRGGKAD